MSFTGGCPVLCQESWRCLADSEASSAVRVTVICHGAIALSVDQVMLSESYETIICALHALAPKNLSPVDVLLTTLDSSLELIRIL